jgi:hypothetical protein
VVAVSFMLLKNSDEATRKELVQKFKSFPPPPGGGQPHTNYPYDDPVAAMCRVLSVTFSPLFSSVWLKTACFSFSKYICYDRPAVLAIR